jgi:hypothetical protein
VVRNQIGNLIPNPSFDHNLYFKCPNGSWEPILDIYVLRAFQWYKEIFNPISFDSYNRPLKIWDSIGTPTPKLGVHLGVCEFIPSHSPTLLGAWNVTPRPTPLQALTLVASPRLGLQPLGHAREYFWVVHVLTSFSPTPTSSSTTSTLTTLHLESDGYFLLFLENYKLD